VFAHLSVPDARHHPSRAEQTNAANLTPQAIAGKHLWDKNNCMGCHTILGEGAYYAPELTKVYERRGPEFIKAMLRDPEAMYPGQRRMVKYDFTDAELEAMVAFLKWIGEMDLNGFPPEPTLLPVAVPGADVVAAVERPKVFNQLCIACHSLGGQGGIVGPALDDVGNRLTYDNLIPWLTDPQKIKPGTAMPKLPLSSADIVELASFLSQMKQQPGTVREGTN